jgi:hypothetical protein
MAVTESTDFPFLAQVVMRMPFPVFPPLELASDSHSELNEYNSRPFVECCSKHTIDCPTTCVRESLGSNHHPACRSTRAYLSDRDALIARTMLDVKMKSVCADLAVRNRRFPGLRHSRDASEIAILLLGESTETRPSTSGFETSFKTNRWFRNSI